MTEKHIHPGVALYAREYADHKLSRRDFLSRATMLGLSASAAYGIIGATMPTPAAAAPVAGGTLRVNMETKAISDPRIWAWTEMSNFARGWLEYLSLFNRDGTVTGDLLESWEINDTADVYILNLRKDVTWNNGDTFTSEDVVHNLTRWADGTVEGNSMASRVAALQDPDTKKLADGTITVIDDHTIQLNLRAPDISLIAGFSDYPAAIVHRSFDGGDPSEAPIGTGAYLPVENLIGEIQVLEKNPNHTYWREGAYLDRIEFIDLGTDQSAVLAAIDSDLIDLTYRTDADYVEVIDGLGWAQTSVVTANTIAVRFNQRQAPYDDPQVRRALQMAVDNNKVLELALSDLGTVGENHHVSTVHPEYAEMAAPEFDPAKAKGMIDAAGHADTEFELISIDTEWQSNTCDAVAAQLRDAGIGVKRTILPGATFWNNWLGYAWSATEWGPRPLGIQIMQLAYKSDAAWNETGLNNAEFDALVDKGMGIADAEARREIMASIQNIMRDEGVLIQPYWRSLYNHSNGKFANTDMHPFYRIDLHDIHLVG
ncbi:MAG: ABC transporter substrate-binding protein [Pseudomonadota bacterium]